MAFIPAEWTRLECRDLPVYIQKGKPAWFVPNRAGDRIIRELGKTPRGDLSLSAERFLSRLPDTRPESYEGRAAYLETAHIRELWFHVTDNCNLACSHCLFASGPGRKASLKVERIIELAEEAHGAGCRVVVLTGGEPLVHRDFDALLQGLLSMEDLHVVILTNGVLLKERLNRADLDLSRLHLQISVDGLERNHDRIRGRGRFRELKENLGWLSNRGIPYSISMCVDSRNMTEMPELVDFAAGVGASNLHFMWYFIRGRGGEDGFVDPLALFEPFKKAVGRSEVLEIPVDNIEALKTQVFAPPGTIHDGSTSGWESLAVGVDGRLYPSAALVGVEGLATPMDRGLVHAWQTGEVLDRVRKATAAGLEDPMKYILGGGDTDHSFFHGGRFTGADPYALLHEKIALWLITREAESHASHGDAPGLLLKMGDRLESCGAHGFVALTHPNCLLALAREGSHAAIKAFYKAAADETREDILNPVCYPEELIDHIPGEFRFRGYGCGSPVLDAGIREGEAVVDLGSGRGVECFIASRMVGPSGSVTGIDMLDPMLGIAEAGKAAVADRMGYRNLEFRKGLLEALPLEEGSTDLVLSNCVMNLSVNKRRSFGEIFRVLRDGGRLVISDVVCETEPSPSIRNDESLRGECIAGAFTQKDLIALLRETGFHSVKLIKRFFYREVNGHPFYSLTYEGVKPLPSKPVTVVYRGPMSSLETPGGYLLHTGVAREIPRNEADLLGDAVFLLDREGEVVNLSLDNQCSCAVPPEARGGASDPMGEVRFAAGCMVCGSRLDYFSVEREEQCRYCDALFKANAACEKGHFVCDGCHSKDARDVLTHILKETEETDMVALLSRIRSHPAVPVHGPEHHFLVPGIIVAAYRNMGGMVAPGMIETAISRGAQVAGGFCGFMGVCGAAVGVGIAFALIWDSNPVKPKERRDVQSATAMVLTEIARFEAARCCQRDSWIALTKAAELSEAFLPLKLRAEGALACTQRHSNKECMGKGCPLCKWPAKENTKKHIN